MVIQNCFQTDTGKVFMNEINAANTNNETCDLQCNLVQLFSVI